MSKLSKITKSNKILFSITVDKEKKEWVAQKNEVIEIIRKVPKEKLPEYIEMCILVGDIVINYASIQTSEECLEKYFGDISKELKGKVDDIESLRQKVEQEITQNLPVVIKEKIELEIKATVTELIAQIEALRQVKDQIPETVKAELQSHVEALKQIKDQIPNTIKSELSTHIDALKQVKDQLPDTMKAELTEHITKLEDNITVLKGSSEILSLYLRKFSVASEKGAIGEEFVYNVLVDNFKEDTFEAVSKKGTYSDIMVKESSNIVSMLIEVKTYKESVPANQVEKFWRDLNSHKIDVGCFISLGAKIQGGIGDYKIEAKGDKLGVFMNVGMLGEKAGYEDGIKLAYFITRKFAQYAMRIKQESMEESELRTKISSILLEIDSLKSKLEKLQDVHDNLENIIRIAGKSKTEVDAIYSECMTRINTIMSNKIEKS